MKMVLIENLACTKSKNRPIFVYFGIRCILDSFHFLSRLLGVLVNFCDSIEFIHHFLMVSSYRFSFIRES